MLILDLCARAPLLVKCTRPFLRTGSQEPRPANNRCKLFLPDLPFSENQIIRVSFVNAVPNELFKPKRFLFRRVLDEIGVLEAYISKLRFSTLARLRNHPFAIYLTLKILRELLRYQSRVRGACATNKQGERKEERVKEKEREQRRRR